MLQFTKTEITFEILDILKRLSEKNEYILSQRPLPNIALKKLQETLQIEWTYNSNGIEGNSLTLIETQVVLQEGITIGGKSLREHFEVINHQKGIEEVFALASKNYKLRSIDILSLHQLVLNNIDADFAGRLRTSGVRITGANFTPPNASKVSDLIDEIIEYINTNPNNLHPIVLATLFHHWFVWIHPFFDGNGRTVRLAMNLILLKFGYPPAIILKNDRKKYYEALNNANNGNYEKLLLMMCQAVERSINIYENAMAPNDYSAYDSISNIVNEADVVYSMEYISLLARKGKIAAHKEGRNWYTSRKAIDTYINSIQKKIKPK